MTDVLLIALDGATWDLLKPWMAQGKLPLLDRLTREGTHGTLMSTVPWATPIAFASLASGMNPGKSGVYDFGRLKGENYTSFVPTNRLDIQGPSLWRILSDAQKSSLVINMPMTYPAEEINGHLVVGIPYPSGQSQLCFPDDLLGKLKQENLDLARNASDDLAGTYETYFSGLLELVRVRGEATATLINENNPDFVAVHFLEPDQAQHRFWQFMKDEPRYDQNGVLTDAILQIYQQAEIAMQQIIDAAGKDVTICVMSDHGFGPTRHQVWLNNWLVQNEYCVFKSNIGVNIKQWLYKIGLSPASIRERAPEKIKLALLQFFEQQKGRALASVEAGQTTKPPSKGFMDKLVERVALDFYDLDWPKTVAFSTGTTAVGYVYLNRVGRDPQGIIDDTQYDSVRKEIAGKLKQWNAVGQVDFPEDLWSGNQLKDAPDLIVRWAKETTDARYFQTRFSSHELIKPVPNDYASHRPEGMFILHGTGVKSGKVQDADILDLTPTLLWLMGQPVPTYMDGEVLVDCFEERNEVEFVEVELKTADTSQNILTAAEEAAIKASLRGLGYIE